VRDVRKYAKQTDIQLGVGAFLLLFLVGIGLIYIIYGSGAAVLGFLCLLAGLAPLVLIFLSLELLDWIQKRANRENPARISNSLSPASGIDTQLIQFEGWTLRARSSQSPKRLLLLIHGFTGDENSMWVFARDLPPHYWMIAPRAPHVAETGGYSWRPLPSSDFGMPSLEQLRPSAEALIRLIDAYQSSVYPEPSRRARIEAGGFDMMGFSQGAVMCNVLAFLYPHRIRKVGILAGFVPSGLEALVSQRPLDGKPFFVTHGAKDETVTIDRARASIALLEQAGAQVNYCEDEVGHKVSVNCLNALKKFFAD